jgi:dipeptidase E
MKKILLVSSSGFLHGLLGDFVNKPLDEVKIAWITTAKKGSLNKGYVENHRNKMTELGWNFEEMDIEGKTERELRDLLENKDVIYMHGGNTFYLLRAIRAGAFEKIVKEKVDSGVLYVGASAGAYVACPTIQMAEWNHDKNYIAYEDQDLTGMSLVPFVVKVHYEPRYQDDIRNGMRRTDLETYILNDQQALYIEDGAVTLVGEGEKIQF